MWLATPRRLLHLLRIAWQVRRLRRAHAPQERQLAQAALSRVLAGGRGLSMKFGQIYADRSGAEPLRELLDGVEPLPLAAILPLIERELGESPGLYFAEIEPSASAASLGQVHRGRMHDGREVAIKVRYPDIEQALEAELRLTGLLPGVGPVRRWGFDLDGYRRTLRDNFTRELDYRDEAQRQALLAGQLQVTGLVLPKVLPELCRRGLLVQEWQAGEPLRVALDWPLGERLQIGRSLLQGLFQSLFVIGEIHGDPHAGNLQVRRTAHGVETLLHDYGCTLSLARERRLALLQLILALRGEGPPVDPMQSFIALGFSADKLAHIAPEMPQIARLLLRPLLLDAPFDPAQWGLGEGFEGLLGVRRWWFRSAGPADMLLLMRVFQGLVNHLQGLQLRLPWWPLLVQAVGEETLEQARRLTLPPLPGGLAQQEPVVALARQLRVEGREAGKLLVDLQLPADAALELATLIPAELVARIEAQRPGEVARAMQQARERGLAPQGLFEWSQDGREYRVWLE